jgi:HEPN domain-containing protein
MSGRPDVSVPAREWMERAEQDLLAAESLLGRNSRRLLNPICYHAQQAAEKYLKALLLHQGVEFPLTHDLRLLLELVGPLAAPGVNHASVIGLTRYAIQARYPGDWEPIDRREAGRAVATARSVGKAVKAVLDKRPGKR